MTFRVSVDDREARREIAVIRTGLSDLRGFFPLVVPLFTRWMERQFATSGSFGGRPWAHLAPATVANKTARGLRPNILQATGALKQAASRPERSQTPTTLTLTIRDPKLPFHQEGTSRMPARPLLFGDPLGSVPRHELDAAAETYVRSLLGSALRR